MIKILVQMRVLKIQNHTYLCSPNYFRVTLHANEVRIKWSWLVTVRIYIIDQQDFYCKHTRTCVHVLGYQEPILNNRLSEFLFNCNFLRLDRNNCYAYSTSSRLLKRCKMLLYSYVVHVCIILIDKVNILNV